MTVLIRKHQLSIWVQQKTRGLKTLMFASHSPSSAEGKTFLPSCSVRKVECLPQCPARRPRLGGLKGAWVLPFSSLCSLHHRYHFSYRSSGVGANRKRRVMSFPTFSNFFFQSLGFYKTLTPKHIKSLSCLQNLQLHRVCLSLVIIT